MGIEQEEELRAHNLFMVFDDVQTHSFTRPPNCASNCCECGEGGGRYK